MKEKLQNTAWLVFLLLGLLQVSSSLQSLCILCLQPDHWDWLTRDPEALDYLTLTWRWLGVTGLTFGIWTLVITLAGYRKGERWTWFAMWLWPAFLIGQGIVFPWSWPVIAVLLVFAAYGLALPYPKFFPKHAG